MNILMAYPFIRSRVGGYIQLMHDMFEDDPTQWPGVMIDSGAFSVHKGNHEVSLPEYADWLDLYHQDIDVYVGLDVIGDAPATEANLQYLWDRGLDPLPVFHPGATWDHMDRYLEHTDYIGLGGWAAIPHARAVWPSWVATVFRRYPGVRFHGFGMTKLEYILDFPWYSIDSSSWGASYRYGRLWLWDGKRFRVVSIGGKSWDNNGVAVARWAQRLVREYGFDPHDLYGDRYRNYTAAQLSALSWNRMERQLNDQGRDLRIYLVDSNPRRLSQAWKATRGVFIDNT